MPTSIPPPLRADLILVERDPRTGKDRSTGKTSKAWQQWFLGLNDQVDASAQQIRRLPLTAQGAAIPSTPIPMAALLGGLYRLSYYIRVTRAATTSSSLQVTIGHTDGAVLITDVGAALTGNLTSTHEGRVIPFKADQSSPITYAVAYASVGATTMLYAIDLIVEQM
jgi:hypothetical protein